MQNTNVISQGFDFTLFDGERNLGAQREPPSSNHSNDDMPGVVRESHRRGPSEFDGDESGDSESKRQRLEHIVNEVYDDVSDIPPGGFRVFYVPNRYQSAPYCIRPRLLQVVAIRICRIFFLSSVVNRLYTQIGFAKSTRRPGWQRWQRRWASEKAGR